MIHPKLQLNRTIKKTQHSLWTSDNPVFLKALLSELCIEFEQFSFDIEGKDIIVKYGGYTITKDELQWTEWRFNYDDYSENFECFLCFCEGFERAWIHCEQEARRLGAL